MGNEVSRKVSLSPETTEEKNEEKQNVISMARSEQILITRLELEYKRKTKTLYVRGTGTEGIPYALTNSYYDMLENQLHNLKKLITPSVKNLKSNFVMQVDISEQGEFNLDLLNIAIKVDFPKYPAKETVLCTFAEPFRVLRPFADYTNSLSVRGHQYRLAVIEGDLTLSLEDFMEVIQVPVVGPRTEKQWLSFAAKVYKEGKKQYNLNITIPCIDGELVWDVKEKQIFLQHQERF